MGKLDLIGPPAKNAIYATPKLIVCKIFYFKLHR